MWYCVDNRVGVHLVFLIFLFWPIIRRILFYFIIHYLFIHWLIFILLFCCHYSLIFTICPLLSYIIVKCICCIVSTSCCYFSWYSLFIQYYSFYSVFLHSFVICPVLRYSFGIVDDTSMIHLSLFDIRYVRCRSFLHFGDKHSKNHCPLLMLFICCISLVFVLLLFGIRWLYIHSRVILHSMTFRYLFDVGIDILLFCYSVFVVFGSVVRWFSVNVIQWCVVIQWYSFILFWYSVLCDIHCVSSGIHSVKCVVIQYSVMMSFIFVSWYSPINVGIDIVLSFVSDDHSSVIHYSILSTIQ